MSIVPNRASFVMQITILIPNSFAVFRERERLGRIRRSLAGGILDQQRAHPLGEFAITSAMIRETRQWLQILLRARSGSFRLSGIDGVSKANSDS